MNRGQDDTMTTLGVVCFLNARPLIEGLETDPTVRLEFAVPSALAEKLQRGHVDAALIPVIDLARWGSTDDNLRTRWEPISDACIGSDGETMTVRVFSRVPPEQMSTIHVDGDSHTSVALAQLIWSRYYKRRLECVPLDESTRLDDCESVLLIGDKVVTRRPTNFTYDIDLGAAWKEWTGLPFVFAVWAAPLNRPHDRLTKLLNDARCRGVARARDIAAEVGPALGWPVALAREYLTERLTYTLTPPAREGMRRFLELAKEEGLVPTPEEQIR